MDQSPFRSILGTNHVPTERECDMITEFLLMPQAQLAELQAKIMEQEVILQKLKAQCKDLRDNINAHRAIISLIRRLPDDILREIFVYCLPPNRTAGMCATEPPLLLAHVCERWRRVAMSTPRLWSSLRIPAYREEAQVSEGKLDLRKQRIMQWIDRTGSVPLSLSFTLPPISDGSNFYLRRRSNDMKRLFSLLSSTFSRWKKLEVFLDESEEDLLQIARMQDENGQTPFQMVEELSLHIMDDLSIGDSERRKVPVFLNELRLNCNARLHRLGLYLNRNMGTQIGPLSLHKIIPCNQLEVLDLQGSYLPFESCSFPIDTLASILQACPKLVVFKANISPPISSFAASVLVPTSEIALHKLKYASLFFPDWNDDHILRFTAKCDWPSLTSLYIRRPSSGDDSIYLLPVLVDRFASKLTSLRLSHSDIPKRKLGDLMLALPLLVQLHLEHPAFSQAYEGEETFDAYDHFPDSESFDDTILALLTPNPDGTPHALPLLRFLKWERNTEFTDKALAHLIQQRSVSPSSPTPLKQVHIVFGRPIQCDILPDCASLIDAGLDLRLKYPPSLDGFTDESGYWKLEPARSLDADYRTLGWD
ncbi:hypothetical protein MD484_g604, partial [Candolleomyces efflorescens]